MQVVNRNGPASTFVSSEQWSNHNQMATPTTHQPKEGFRGLSGGRGKLSAESFRLPDIQWSQTMHRVVPRLVVGAGALLLIVAIGLLAFRVMFDDRIYPAVVVGDVEVGGLTLAQAEERLADRASELNQNSVSFTYGDQTWTPTLAELGATIKTGTALQEASALGRENDAVSRLAFTGNILQSDQTVPLETSLDLRVLDGWFDKVDADIGDPAIDATIIVDGTTVSFTQDATGIVVDREAAKTQVVNVLETLKPVDTDLPTVVEEPVLRTADLQEGKARVEQILSQPVRIQFEDQSWRVEPATISQFMTVTSKMQDGRPQVDVDLDRSGLGSFLRETYAGEINREPTNATVAWQDGTGLIATSTSVDGAAVLTNDFASVVAESFLNGHDRVDVPVHVTKPEIDSNNLAALKIETRMGRGDSNFINGDEARDTNIRIGSEAVNGTLVAPGEDFSFNGAVGAITEDKGYQVAGVILGDQIGRDVGGGICQVSTTVYRAALMSGFPMAELWPHTFRLAGYERDGWGPGYDASILQLGDNPATWADFRFTNNTDGWLLIQSWISYPHHVVEIFGPDMGWNVEITDEWNSGPIKNSPDKEVIDYGFAPGTVQQTGWPQDGLSVGYTRNVYDANGELVRGGPFKTDFMGTGNVYSVSEDMVGQSPAAN